VPALALPIRWLHLAAAVWLAGTFAFLLLAGRPVHPTAREWERRLTRLAPWVVLLLLLSGLAALALQAALVTGRPAAALSGNELLALLAGTQFGTVWLLRHGLLLLLAALVLLRDREETGWDWAAFRGEGFVLAAVGLGLLAWAGHAAAVEPWGLAAAAAHALHLLAVGVWLGGLLPLALLLRAAGPEAGADARPFAVLAAHGFSRVALVAMLALLATGFWNAWNQVGDVPALLGTRYGRLLLAKLALLLPILALAAWNRRRLLPALGEDAETTGRPAMQRLGRFVALEAALGAAILAVVATMAVTPPGRHTQPTWPLPLRLSYAAVADLPGVQARILVGSQLALLGALGALAGWSLARRRRLAAGLGAAVSLAGIGLALPPLAVEAYPTTYHRPSVPYQAVSIANGRQLYARDCAPCHGVAIPGEGLAPPDRRAPDLGDPRLERRTAGDLFWWVTRRHPDGPGAPPGEEEAWDLVNFLRTLSAGARARALSAAVEPDRPRLVAPDFTFAVGPGATQALRDFRGRRAVLLVLFRLPHSRGHLDRLARHYDILVTMGAEVVAVPTDGGKEIIARLGPVPRILFPVVTEGAEEIVRTYDLLRPGAGPHAEFLIDRQGYLRARWAPDGAGWTELTGLLAELEQLNRERPTGPPPDEHIH
jgi:putative copper resistance protein D